eukprot:4819389-Amphidinium_carterae.1
MQLYTRRYGLGILWHPHLTSLLVPVRASKDDVREVLRFLLASHTKRSYMERTIRAHFMPDPSQGSVESTSKAVFRAVGTFLQVSKTLSA